jgi:hypothetical protein
MAQEAQPHCKHPFDWDPSIPCAMSLHPCLQACGVLVRGAEGVQPAELGWGTHESALPADGRTHDYGGRHVLRGWLALEPVTHNSRPLWACRHRAVPFTFTPHDPPKKKHRHPHTLPSLFLPSLPPFPHTHAHTQYTPSLGHMRVGSSASVADTPLPAPHPTSLTPTRSAIYLTKPGITVKVRSWTPLEGHYHGFLVTHDESISLAEYYTVPREGDDGSHPMYGDRGGRGCLAPPPSLVGG